MTEENIVVGAGITGAIISRQIAEVMNEKVLVIDRRSEIGGNVHDYKDLRTGITIQKYGPHIFHTNNEFVWKYLSKYTDWYPFVFEPKVVINKKAVTLPFNLNTLHEVFSDDLAVKLEKKLITLYGYNSKIPILELKNTIDEDLKYLADFIYENVFKNYTIKQWGLKPEDIDPSVTARVPVFISKDNRYFQDKYQGIPLNGYTNLVRNILNHPNINVKLNTDWKNVTKKYHRLIYTGSIDEFFNYKYGKLPYRSLSFDIKYEEQEFYQESAMVNYPNECIFTRITEHKYFLNEKSNNTVISIEYPQEFIDGINERYYPISNSNNQALYNKYKNEAKNISNLYFAGRLGEYKYYNMDLAVERALKLFEEEIK